VNVEVSIHAFIGAAILGMGFKLRRHAKLIFTVLARAASKS
jgi:hypothetical protein